MQMTYSERLYLRQEQSWILYLLGFDVIIMLALMIGLKAPAISLVLVIGVLGLVTGIICLVRLETRLSPEGIFIRYYPQKMKFRHFSPADIQAIRTVQLRQRKITSFGVQKRKHHQWYAVHFRHGVALFFQSGEEVSFSIASRESWVYYLNRLKENPQWQHINFDLQG